LASALSETDRARLAVGGLPATPIMRWLKERGGPLDGFSQSMLLRVPAGLSQQHLTAALAAVLDHHDALRLRLTLVPQDRMLARRDAEWQLEVMPPGSVAAWIACGGSMLPVVDDAALRELIAAEAEAAERRLSPTSGTMVQALWFDAGPGAAGGCGLRSIILRSTGCRGGSWCRTLRRPGRRSRPDRPSRCAAGDLVPGLGGAACGACASRQRCAGASILARDATRAVAAASAERLDPLATRLARPGI
jgi:hypothetical protein